MPVTIINAGQRAWDPARIHLSYHWLWLVPRELARRSRTVPYHDGIRTKLGERGVAPGEQLELVGRLLPPATPGLYWLQWDMVEEGTTWFAQVAPRQPRALVVVLPPAAWLFAPLPLVVALLGIVGLIRAADVWWCAAALATKPLILAYEALLEPTVVAYWLVAAVALLVPSVALLVLPRRTRPAGMLVVGVLGSLVIFGDVVYYRFFGDVLSTPTLFAAHHLFLARGLASICYDVMHASPASMADCRAADEESRRVRDLSRLVVVDDLQERLAARLASAIR